MAILGLALMVIVAAAWLAASYPTNHALQSPAPGPLRLALLQPEALHGNATVGSGRLVFAPRRGESVAATYAPYVDAAGFPYLRLSFAGSVPSGSLTIRWFTAQRPHRGHHLSYPCGPGRVLTIPLYHHPGWEGEVSRLSISFAGPDGSTLSVTDATLFPPAIAIHLAVLWEQWTAVAPWDQRSINFVAYPVGRSLLTPVPFAVSVAALTLTLAAVVRLLRHRRLAGLLAATAVVLPWLLLDARWLHQSARKLESAATRNPAIEGGVRPGALNADDARLQEFADAIRASLPADPVKLLIVTPTVESARFSALRLKYHLLPINSSVASVSPEDLTTVGDHIGYVAFVGDPPAGITLRPRERALRIRVAGPREFRASTAFVIDCGGCANEGMPLPFGREIVQRAGSSEGYRAALPVRWLRPGLHYVYEFMQKSEGPAEPLQLVLRDDLGRYKLQLSERNTAGAWVQNSVAFSLGEDSALEAASIELPPLPRGSTRAIKGQTLWAEVAVEPLLTHSVGTVVRLNR